MKLASSIHAPTASLTAGAAARRDRILQAAMRLFVSAPYDLVQMDDIARMAGVAKPTVYRHFPTKEVLFVEALDAILAKLKGDVAEMAAGSASAPDRLRAIVAVMFREIGRLKASIRVAEGGGARPGDAGRAALRRSMRELRREIANVIRDGVRAGTFAVVDAELAALVVLGGVRMAADGGSDDPAPAVMALLLNGLAHRSFPPLPSA